MLPPNSDCRPPKKLPTIERERTVIPRTIPRFGVTVWPGSANAPVIIDCCITASSDYRYAGAPASIPRRTWAVATTRSCVAGLEQFYRVAGRVLHEHLFAARTGDDFAAK